MSALRAFTPRDQKAGEHGAEHAEQAEHAQRRAPVDQARQQLPGEREIPLLLEQIAIFGKEAGVEFLSFRPAAEVKKDFYAELPITIRLTGGYHEMGRFAGGIAALPRIVTLHDVVIGNVSGKDGGGGKLYMEAKARTYRYLDPAEMQANRDQQKKKKAGGKKK